jgi:hypothetical protein
LLERVLGGFEATLHQHSGNLLVRVAAVSPSHLSPSEAYGLTVTAVNTAMAPVVANAGTSQQVINQTCQ